jgi:hypothetical protein
VLASLPSLQKALSPFAIVDADLGELCDLLEGRYLTCHEAAELFRQWLSEKNAVARDAGSLRATR